ncbi:hypothetical protein [Paenibacillus sp. S25]|uniref:hypothetical protein n=1 Tax=Paenibacillus sp. S25 TaxID=2823905 RepID=UPI0021ACE4A2|nr:hypothetical protein [Paenibacillus sp. S25]QYK64570.1 hypothetical protein KAI37_04958 [Paenibacillus sp. S25]
MKKLFVLVLVVLIFSGCGLKKEVEEKGTVSKSAISTASSHELTYDSSKAIVQESNKLDLFIKKIQPANMKLQKLIKQDIDKEGTLEFVIAFGKKSDHLESIYVVRNKDDHLKIIGKLDDPIVTEHINKDVKVMHLDQTKRDFIVVYSTSEVDEAEGFSIFTLDHNRISNLNYNYPEATGQGIRKLKDINKDSVFEDVSYYRFQDTQQHTIMTYQKFDRTGPERSEVLYGNKDKKFVYPTVPKDIIQNYLEDHYLMNRFLIHLPEMAEFTALSENPKNNFFEDIIDFSTMDYTGLDLNIKEIANKADQRAFLVKSNSEEEESNQGLVFTLEKQSGKWRIMSIELNDKS